MAQNDIEDLLDQSTRIKSGGDLNSVKVDQIETLEMELRFLRTFIKYHHVFPPDSLYKITNKAQSIDEMLRSVLGGNTDESKPNLNVERLVSQLLDSVEGNTCSIYNFELSCSYLLEYMDYLHKNLNDAPRCLVRFDTFFRNKIKILQKTDRFLKQVKIIQKKIKILRDLYAREMSNYIDHEKLEGVDIRIQFKADNVVQFCFALWNTHEDDIAEIESKPPFLLCLLTLVELEMQKIFIDELKDSKFGQSRTFKDQKLPQFFALHLHSVLFYLRKNKLENLTSTVSARNIDVAIEFLLVFLADVPSCYINGKSLNDVLKKAVVLVGDILCVLQKLLPSAITKIDTSEINVASIHISEKTENLKAQVEDWFNKSQQFTPSQFPTVGGLSFLLSFQRKLNETLKSDLCLDSLMKPHVGVLEKELSSLTFVFRNVEKVHQEHEFRKDLQKRIINLAYEAEVAIDSIVVQCNVLWHLFCSLPTIIKEIKQISAEVTKMWSENFAIKPFSVVEPSKDVLTQRGNPINDEEIVGFEDYTERIIQLIIRGTNEVDVIPIVGMGGKGKTTFARKLYNNDIVVSRFDVRAWCSVSQTYSRREVLQEIFSHVTDFKDNDYEAEELADMLRKSLMRKRYLIVLDDMWDGKAWDDLRLSFPDVENGSRVLVTTRLEKVGEQVKHHTDPFILPFLTPEESCLLLHKRVFQQQTCPPELQDVSLEVAKRCKGLPLVVVLVAGIVKRKKMEASWWHEVENALFSFLSESEEYVGLATMQLSYDYLPDHLRPCLLYMGMFPEDYKIPVSRLMNLWVAEGFVSNVESGRLGEVAEGYLMDLISDNLVIVSKRRYNGKVKYCQVHDIVLHFCLAKSREEKFMLAVKEHYSHFCPSDWNETRLSYHLTDRQVSVLGSTTGKTFHQHLRSVVTTSHNISFFQDWINPIPQITQLRLLRVLDLCEHGGLPDDLSSSTFHPLIHLKYLSVNVKKFDFQPGLHLCHLETLIVIGRIVNLPDSFFNLEKLRHVEFGECEFNWIIGVSSKLENLKFLGKILLSHRCVNALSWMCPNIQDLSIRFDCPLEENCTYAFQFFTQLQSLSLATKILKAVISGIHLPSNLKKLSLSQAHLTKGAVSMIAGLPSLEYLMLWKIEFDLKDEWCLGDTRFDKLKKLALVFLDISRWDASEESFPMLETLVISYVYLEEIPLNFAYIPTLKKIKLSGCKNESLEASAVKIKDEIKENEGSDDRLNLIIIKQRVIIKLPLNRNDQERRSKAFKIAVSHPGVEAAAMRGEEKNQLEVVGEIDAVELATLLRKNLGPVEILSVGPVTTNKNKEESGSRAKPQLENWR